MKKAYYRIRQYIFSIFINLLANKNVELIKKENSFLSVVDILKEKNINNILIVTTKGFIKRNTLSDLLSLLDENDISFTIFSNVNPDPSVVNVEEGYKEYLYNRCKAIVAIGGGSVIDCSKIIAARVSNPNKSVRDMKGLLKVNKKLPLLIPIPTTCGTGSEITAAAVISDVINNKCYKYAISDFKLIPSIAILDASLLKTLPPFMLSTTTMDALTHALEAYTNLFASKKTTNEALEAIKLIFNNFEKAYFNNDILAINNLLYASYLAGDAFSHNFVGYVHAIAHAIGAIYHLPHGYLNAIILPVVLKSYGSKIEKKMEVLCKYLYLDRTDSYASVIIDKINELNRKANIEPFIKELREEDFDEIAIRAINEANPCYPVPIIYNQKDIKQILYKLIMKA